MQQKTRQYIEELIKNVEIERQQIHDNLFIHSHPNLVFDNPEANKKELERYRKFHEKGFDRIKEIEKMVVLDNVLSDLKAIIFFNFDFKNN